MEFKILCDGNEFLIHVGVESKSRGLQAGFVTGVTPHKPGLVGTSTVRGRAICTSKRRNCFPVVRGIQMTDQANT